MSKTLTVRDVPEPVLKGLRHRARRNQRSMQKEILAILAGATLDRESFDKQLSAWRATKGRLVVPMTLDEIHQAIDEGRS